MDRRIAGQGEACVLAMNAKQQFGEIVETSETHCALLLPDGQASYCSKAELASGVFTAVPATKVIKGNGEWMYFAPGVKSPRNVTGTAWFTRGGVFV